MHMKQLNIWEKKAQVRIFFGWLGLTTGQSARHCQVSLPASKRLIQDRRLTACKTSGGHRRLGLEELQYFLRQYRMPLDATSTPDICILIAEDNTPIVDRRDEALRTISQQRWHIAK